jgi:hypothetical protein
MKENENWEEVWKDKLLVFCLYGLSRNKVPECAAGAPKSGGNGFMPRSTGQPIKIRQLHKSWYSIDGSLIKSILTNCSISSSVHL